VKQDTRSALWCQDGSKEQTNHRDHEYVPQIRLQVYQIRLWN